MFFVIFFAFIYKNPLNWKKPGIYRLSEETKEEKSFVSFWESLYFSTNIFTSLGTLDWRHRNEFWKVVTLEAFIGWIMLGIFSSTLIHLMMRNG